MQFNITPSIVYIGVNDRQKEKFENMIPLPLGISYNSYLIVDEKTALIDTVEVAFADNFIENILHALQGKALDYLIVNHMEPDHSGSIRTLRQYFPSVQIIGNKKTLEMIDGFYGIADNCIAIKDGDTLSLGENTLQFYLTPMVHWPETMMTYCPEQKALFSGDAFGCFGTLNGAIMDEELIAENYWDEMVRYYANIVGKYGAPVQKALQKLEPLALDYICSTHGPVWHKYLPQVVNMYHKMSLYEPLAEGAVVVYGSMYGNTERMAEAVAKGLAKGGIKNIIMHNASRSDASDILRDIFKYKIVIIGSPTYNNSLYPAIESLLSKIEGRTIKPRIFGAFGSFSWASAAIKHLKLFAERLQWEIVETVEMKQGGTSNHIDACIQLGEECTKKI